MMLVKLYSETCSAFKVQHFENRTKPKCILNFILFRLIVQPYLFIVILLYDLINN